MISMFWIKGVMVAVLLGVLTTGYFAWRTTQRGIGAAAQFKIDQADMQRIQDEAKVKLAEVIAAKDAAEQALIERKNKQEVIDAKSSRVVADLRGRLASLAVAGAGRLRDPHADVGCGGGGSEPTRPPTATASTGGDNGAQAGGLLSKEATGLLLELTAEADAVNLAYASCRAQVMGDAHPLP